MVDSIAAASFLGHRTIYGGFCLKLDVSVQKSRLIHMSSPLVKSGLTKEAFKYRERKRIPRDDIGLNRKPMLWPLENRVDNPSIHNPLLRQERMGSGWLTAIFELEGVLIEDNPELEKQAWHILSQEEGKPPPLTFLLRRIEGMKTEQVVSEVLCWSRDPKHVKRLANRKEEIHQSLQGGIYRFKPGSEEFLKILMKQRIPMALVSTRPRKVLETAILSVGGIEGVFTVIVAADDVYRGKPDPEMFNYAAQLMSFDPQRCIVFGDSNLTVEAAHDARMKCVVVAGKHPVYELAAADLVVRRLDEISIVDLKNLAALEEPELEMEEEEDARTRLSIATIDDFW